MINGCIFYDMHQVLFYPILNLKIMSHIVKYKLQTVLLPKNQSYLTLYLFRRSERKKWNPSDLFSQTLFKSINGFPKKMILTYSSYPHVCSSLRYTIHKTIPHYAGKR